MFYAILPDMEQPLNSHRDTENSIEALVKRVKKVILKFEANKEYTIEDILEFSNIKVEWLDFIHIVLHCLNLKITYNITCSECKSNIGVFDNLPNLPKVCALCHKENSMVVKELFSKSRSISVLKNPTERCSFCGNLTEVGFVGMKNKIVCKNCIGFLHQNLSK
jgi:hypothetical protein